MFIFDLSLLYGEVDTEEEETDDVDQDNDQESYDEINPEDLPENVRASYERLLAEYTRSRQELAQHEIDRSRYEEDSSILETLLSDPDISARAMELFNNGGQAQQKVAPKNDIDPQADPMGWLQNEINIGVRNAIQGVIPAIKNELTPLLSQNEQRMVESEFRALVSEFPAAKDIGMNQILGVMQQHPTLNMQQALTMIDPSAIISRRTGKAPKVEKSSTKSTERKEEDSALSQRTAMRNKALANRDKSGKQVSNISSIVRKFIGG